MQVNDVKNFIDLHLPFNTAEAWDNVGLLIGQSTAPVSKILTCLTVTPEVVREAVGESIDLIITHHPFPFRAGNVFTDETVEGTMILDLIANQIAVISPHTAFDSAREGINAQIAEALGLKSIKGIRRDPEREVDIGRMGTLSGTGEVKDILSLLKRFLGCNHFKVAHPSENPVAGQSRSQYKIAIACGSGGELLRPAILKGADVFISGELSFHEVLYAKANHTTVILSGHYHSERFAIEWLASWLGQNLGIDAIPSAAEKCPIEWLSL